MTEANVRMREVISVDLVSVSHGLVYKKKLEAIKEVRAAQWRKWSKQDVPGCLEGHPDNDERCDT